MTAHSDSTSFAMQPAHRISVIVPIFNRAETIGSCLDSIVGQTLPPTELILVDDGSTDETKAAIKDWQARAEPKLEAIRVSYLSQENQGKSVALNTGFAASNAEWIAFNDSDDLWLSHKLETQSKLLADHPNAGVCFSDSRFINDPSITETPFQMRGFDKVLREKNVISEPYKILAQNPNGIFMQSLIARRDCAEQVFPLDTQLRVAQDIDLIFRLSLTTAFCFTHEALVEIDRTPERKVGLTKQHDLKSLYRLETKERIIKGWLLNKHPAIQPITALLNKQLAVAQRRIGLFHKEKGNDSEARRYFKLAFKHKRSLANFAFWMLNGKFPG